MKNTTARQNSGFCVEDTYPFLTKVFDVLMTIRSVWLVLLFNVIALLTLVLTPQGPDMILCIGEDLSRSAINLVNMVFGPSQKLSTWFMPAVWLVISTAFWSVSSEFSSRFFIYMKDNSGRSLSIQRVNFRKHVQTFISRVFLFFPLIVTSLVIIISYFSNLDDLREADKLAKTQSALQILAALAAIILLLGLEAWLFYRLYVQNGINKLAGKYSFLKWLNISAEERLWVTRLNGMLNDVRVDLPMSREFKSMDLPREEPLPNEMNLPKDFIPFCDNPQKEGKLRVWMFRIPLKFYKRLIRQLVIFFIVALIVIICFCFIPVYLYRYVGSIALLFMAFGCWQIILLFIKFGDKAQRVFPIRFALLVLFLVTTFCNRDHPARVIGAGMAGNRPKLSDHFNRWFTNLSKERDTVNGVYHLTGDSIPVVFITAEGGALRTGAFTSMLLAGIQDQYHAFYKHIYCYSSVSGGTLGANFFNAELLNQVSNRQIVNFSQGAEDFYKKDFLSASIGKQVFGEMVNYFIPFHISSFDRAIAMEKAWENGWLSVDTVQSHNIFKNAFDQTVRYDMPALLINTVEVETGNQCIWSNVSLQELPLDDSLDNSLNDRDLYKRTNQQIAYSTAIGLSTRFPIISPGAAFFYHSKEKDQTAEIKRHFVDGGYYENKGSETLLQILNALPLQNKKIKPYILQFNFGEQDSTFRSVNSFNEIMEIIAGIYNTRGARGAISGYYLNKFKEEYNGVLIPLNLTLTSKKFPMNWVLSQTSVERLKKSIGDIVRPDTSTALDHTDKIELHKLFVYHFKPRK